MSGAVFDRTNIGVTYCPPSRGSGCVVRRPAPAAIKVPPEWGDGPGAAWYVVATDPAKEYRVRDCLALEGWRVWLPECVIERQHKRFAGLVSRLKGALFPGYLFARIDMSLARWRILEDERHRDAGIERLLRLDDRPLPVPDDDIERLVALVAEDGGALVIRRGQRRRTLIIGEPVRVIDGPFTGFNGLYQAIEAQDRINILLDIFGRDTLVAMAEAQVEPA
jgi:transcription antitermination factor NusG